MKKIIYILVVLLILAGLAFFLKNNQTATAPAETTVAEEVVATEPATAEAPAVAEEATVAAEATAEAPAAAPAEAAPVAVEPASEVIEAEVVEVIEENPAETAGEGESIVE